MMNIWKVAKDYANKFFLGKQLPREVFELKKYFTLYNSIDFRIEKQVDGTLVAVSTDFHQGRIVTDGRNEVELNANIEDAILTVFSVPSAYAKEVAVRKVDQNSLRYAPAK